MNALRIWSRWVDLAPFRRTRCLALLGLFSLLFGLIGTTAQAADSAIVFMYHRFGDGRHPTTNIAIEQFEAHLQEIASGGYRVMPLDEIVKLVKTHPKARFILLNGLGYTRCPLGRRDNGLPRNYAIELSRLSAVLANELGQLITNLGADRVMFGTGMPFKYPDPALVKLEVLDAGQTDKEKIFSQNAIAWLKL